VRLSAHGTRCHALLKNNNAIMINLSGIHRDVFPISVARIASRSNATRVFRSEERTRDHENTKIEANDRIARRSVPRLVERA